MGLGWVTPMIDIEKRGQYTRTLDLLRKMEEEVFKVHLQGRTQLGARNHSSSTFCNKRRQNKERRMWLWQWPRKFSLKRRKFMPWGLGIARTRKCDSIKNLSLKELFGNDYKSLSQRGKGTPGIRFHPIEKKRNGNRRTKRRDNHDRGVDDGRTLIKVSEEAFMPFSWLFCAWNWGAC